MRRTVAQIRGAGFEWPLHDAITASAAQTGDEIDLAQTLVNLEKARAFYQRQLDEAWSFKQSARSSGWVDADYDDFTDARDEHAAQQIAHVKAIEYVQSIVAAFERGVQPRAPVAPPLPLRLKPGACECGEYTVDAFVVEATETGDLDFRLELGKGCLLYAALPAARNDRLRLVLTDCAVVDVEPEIEADPFVCDLSLAWRGELARLADGRVITSVALDVTQRSYRFRADLRDASGEVRVVELAWRA